jgi:hypothetical protein
MREIDDTDPAHVLALALAANELSSQGGRYASMPDREDMLFGIALLRAGACGWRETHWAFKAWYRGRIARNAAHDAALCTKYAKADDQKADAFCRKMSIAFEFNGGLQGDASILWTEFRTTFVQVGDRRKVWALIALACAGHAERTALAHEKSKRTGLHIDLVTNENDMTCAGELARALRVVLHSLRMAGPAPMASAGKVPVNG